MLILSAVLLSLPWIHIKPFYTKGEPREALAAQYILKTNNWILPKRYGDEFITKPPLQHWVIAGLSQITGKVSPTTSRLPATLASFISVIIFFVFLTKYLSPQKSFLSCFLLLTCVEWHRATTTSRVDMLLAMCMIVALLSFHRFLKNQKFIYYLAGIAGLMGAGLTKGPVGVLLPLAIIGAYGLTQKVKLLQLIKYFLPASIIGAIPLFIWYYLAYLQTGQEFLNIVFVENIQRLTGNMPKSYGGGHSHGIFYLYGTLLVGLLPWMLTFISPWWKKIDYFFLRYPLSALKSLNSFQVFMLLTPLLIVVFYSIPESKRSVYLLPAYPFLAYWIAEYLCLLYKRFPVFLNQVSNFFAGLVLLMSIAACFYWLFLESSYYTYFLVLIVLCLYTLKSKNTLASLPLIFLLFIALNATFLPDFAKKVTAKNLTDVLQKKLPKNSDYYTLGEFYGINFYLSGNVTEISLEPCSKLNKQNSYLIAEKKQFLDMQTNISSCYKLNRIPLPDISVRKPKYKMIVCKITELVNLKN